MENNEQFDIFEQNGKYILSINGVFYVINDITYEIILGLKENKKIGQIVVTIEQKFNIKTNEDEIKLVIEKNIKPLFLKEHSLNRTKTDGFWLKRELFSYEQYVPLVRPLLLLFKHRFFWMVLLFLLLLNFGLLFNLTNPEIGLDDCRDSFFVSLFTYISLFFILILHELGHATATNKYGIKSKSIGFGFYTIFPVFFADVTSIWALSKDKRLIVNLAGIYIQGYIGVLMYFSYLFFERVYPNSLVVQVFYNIFIANGLTMLVNLFPFFKFDGYWCYSDFFNISNLAKKSSVLTKLFLKKVFRVPLFISKEEKLQVELKNSPLIIYTIFKWVTNVFLCLFIIQFLFKMFKKIKTFQFNFDLSFCVISENIYNIILLIILFKFTYSTSKTVIKSIKYFINV